MESVIRNIITYLTKSKKVFCMRDIWHLRASDSKYSLQGHMEMNTMGLSLNLTAERKIEPGHVQIKNLTKYMRFNKFYHKTFGINVYFVRRLSFLIL